MHFASALTTMVLAAKINAAKIEAEMDYLSQYESQYGGLNGYGLGSGPAGPSLDPISLGIRDLDHGIRDLGLGSHDLGLGLGSRDLGLGSRDLGLGSRDLGLGLGSLDRGLAPEPVRTIREPLRDEHYDNDYVHAHIEHHEEPVFFDVPVTYEETEYQIAHKIEPEIRTR